MSEEQIDALLARLTVKEALLLAELLISLERNRSSGQALPVSSA